MLHIALHLGACTPSSHEDMLDHSRQFAIEASMDEQTDKKKAKAETAKEAKDARMKAALRANLQRRKGQARARKVQEKD